MATPQPVLRAIPSDHPHASGELCPYCDQPIPNDRAEEIRARFEAKEREHLDALRKQANEQLARDRQQIEANANAAVDKVRTESAEAIEKVRADAVAQQAAAHDEGRKAAETAAQARIQSLTDANAALQVTASEKIAEAERQRNDAVTQFDGLKANYDGALQQRTQEIREAYEKEKTDALNAEKAQHFEETLKLQEMVKTLERRLAQKTAEELGEGAEVDLYEALKAEFPDDTITRVPKGTAGADIIHIVKHNGKDCGKIVYDSKNRNQWRELYATKLREDQMAAKAEHAILSTCKFPAAAHQLVIREGVIVANPARVVFLADLLRSHIIQCHALRVSGKEREGKTVALYDYITSERFWQRLESFDSCADKLLEIEEAEKKAHDKVWEKRGTAIKSVQRMYGEVRADIERIIGTAEMD